MSSSKKLFQAASGASGGEGEYLFMGGGGGLTIYDVSNPNSPNHLVTLDNATTCASIANFTVDTENKRLYLQDTDAVVGDYSGTIQLWDISDIESPSHVSSTGRIVAGKQVQANHGITVVDEDKVLAMIQDHVGMVDYSTPSSPSVTTSLDVGLPGYGTEGNIILGGSDTDGSSGEQYCWLQENGLLRTIRYDGSSLSSIATVVDNWTTTAKRLNGEPDKRMPLIHDPDNNLILAGTYGPPQGIYSWEYTHANAGTAALTATGSHGSWAYPRGWDADVASRTILLLKDGKLRYSTWDTAGAFTQVGELTDNTNLDPTTAVALDLDNDVAYVVQWASSTLKLRTIDISDGTSMSITNTYDCTSNDSMGSVNMIKFARM